MNARYLPKSFTAITLIVLMAVAGVFLNGAGGTKTNILRDAGKSDSGRIPIRGSDALPAVQGEQAIQALKQSGLYDSLQQAVDATRYEVRREEQPAEGGLAAVYHAPNPAQQLQAYFTPEGIHLAPSEAARKETKDGEDTTYAAGAPQWQARMRLVGYGYGDYTVTAGLGEAEAKGNHLEYRRTGSGITEWYVNTAKGFEQGFTFEAAPAGRIEGKRLRLELEVTGDLRPEVMEDGRSIALKRVGDEIVLRYSDLYAYDAKNRALPSQMLVRDGRMYLEVDDTDGVYPVTIDPTFSLQQALLSSDPATGDAFGSSVAISGDTVVVGAPGDDGPSVNQGAAYVFVRAPSGGTTWSFQQKLVAQFGQAGDGFGHAVAINVGTIVVGAPDDDVLSVTDRGSAFVFVRSGTTWNFRQQLIAPDGEDYDRFGSSVAIAGDKILVGAPYDALPNHHGTLEGSAYVFTPTNGSWTLNQKLTNGLSSMFGSSVAMSGCTAAIGAPFQSSVYVYQTCFGPWTLQQTLTIPTPGLFGSSVAIDGNTLVGGAPLTDAPNQNQGAAYVFVRSGVTWTQQASLTAYDGAAEDRFGTSVSVLGNTVAVGAPADVGANFNPGSVYVFTRGSNGSWISEQPKLSSSTGTARNLFGWAVAVGPFLYRPTVVVGAPREWVLNRWIGWYQPGVTYIYAGN